MNDAHILENLYGRVFALNIGGGACMLVIDKDGQNLSIPLDADQALNLGKFLFFARADEEARQAMHAPVETEVIETFADYEREPMGQPMELPRAAQRPKRVPAKAAKPDARVTWTDAKRKRFIEAFMAEGADTFVDPRSGHFGRTAAASHATGVSYMAAKAQISHCRKEGLIPSSFTSVRGRKPNPRPDVELAVSNGAEHDPGSNGFVDELAAL